MSRPELVDIRLCEGGGGGGGRRITPYCQVIEPKTTNSFIARVVLHHIKNLLYSMKGKLRGRLNKSHFVRYYILNIRLPQTKRITNFLD